MNHPRTALALTGLAPLLGGTDLLVKAIGIGLLGLVILSLCGLLLAPLRRVLQGNALLLAALLLGGLLVSGAELLLQLLSAELFAALALFLPLLLLPCLGLALDRRPTALAGLKPGLLFAALALLLGLLREGLGHATLFSHGDWLFGPAAAGWQLSLASQGGVQLLTLAPGAFILLGLLLAAAHPFHHDERP
ncbi:Rnf-Nqr domain containing protein [Pseudomonas sp.]|uniref:Rnf-Nqr domain containing protein n=1 Tax=Pseudomonas sp. TaxID=306 RepID=UPI002732EC40|nr:Rnf-Nqr domain containing protein [Pseudomonas sp.]MDP3814046.1 Rnf-Nqr domain containing protein [Pseudomonas sp.]